MKRLTIICISFVISLMFISASYAEIGPEAVVGAWLFDEGEGQTAKEFSGKGSDGALVKSPKWVAGKFGKAIKFDGKDDYVEISLPDVFNDIPNNDFAISFWINVQDISGNDTTWTRILEARCDDNNYVQFDIQMDDGELGINVIDAGAEKTLTVDSPIIADIWYHVTGVWDADVDSVGLYLDGVLQSTAGSVPASPGNQKMLNVGRRSDGNDLTYFNGVIDEFAVFNTVLTEEEIKCLAAEGLKAVAAVSSLSKLTTAWGKLKKH